ncbi:MAG: phospho-N-acetylmuramoyl-pentapeptide-transferase, partial [Clostridiales bacterium]|nr:phospho-N-acetylmuramoyl-pentapeptide-transferase [Clostridiales bacterium]
KTGQNVRDDGPQSHLAKQGTPTMGGLLFLLGLAGAALIFAWDSLELVLPALIVTFAFALIGFLDDFLKVRRKRSLGLRARQKIIGQFGFALVAAIWLYRSPWVGSALYIPVWNIEWDLGIMYIPAAMFIIIGVVNAVNLTDGLDGLATSVSAAYMAVMAALFALLAVNATVDYTGMGVFCAALTGGLLGYLIQNAYPAKVFMGDTGALGLGGAVAMVALISRSALLLPVMGICFVGSALSVILQVGSYKLRNKKRIFRMAPLHHHYELGGVHETRIVVMYTLVTLACCLGVLLLYTF